MISIYAHASTREIGRPTQQSACAIILEGVNEDDKQKANRKLGLKLDNVGPDLADIHSLRLALASVKKHYLNDKVSLHTTSQYAASLCVDERETEYEKEVADLRKIADKFGNLSIDILDTSHAKSVELKEIIAQVFESNSAYDSGTISDEL